MVPRDDSDGPTPAAPLDSPPDAPWLASAIVEPAPLDDETFGLLADFTRCAAWSWIAIELGTAFRRLGET